MRVMFIVPSRKTRAPRVCYNRHRRWPFPLAPAPPSGREPRRRFAFLSARVSLPLPGQSE